MLTDKCAVSWCVSMALTARLVCRLHADRPVLHSHERHESYLDRLRKEDAQPRQSAQEKRRANAAAKPVTLF